MSHCIRWQHDGRRIVLPVLILKPSPSTDLNGYEATALVDTGSTTSGVTPRVAEALDLEKRGKRLLGSAQGLGQAQRYLFRIALKPPSNEPIYPYVFEDVSGFELSDSFELDALIGMDILRDCEFSMDRTAKCYLSFG